ncbi:YicC/YloC family endoribonuclease [Candidatus Magnetomonas plexicatena]|uniref:YicC/YloC family endoribonuclease n=1 Tax=Candidatus Magnetomonas plexicatena TaxID=2552947 RepID=UPI001100CECE|nr:YicC family protein [Nitrospirales bacterium LBB_01]
MIQSMTGYGCAQKDSLKVEIRSVNHRYLDISFKSPVSMLKHEPMLRAIIKEHLNRGRVDVYISTTNQATSTRVMINRDFVGPLVDSLNNLKEEFKLSGSVDIASVLSFKETIIKEDEDPAEGTLEETFREALAGLINMRQQEGKHLSDIVQGRLSALFEIITEISHRQKAAISVVSEKLRQRLNELFKDFAIDENRLLQESAILSDKMDISEEIERVESHLKQFNKTLLNNDNIGKGLDFILQELNREANTISSKAGHYDIGAEAVNLKLEIEKLREQIQNIE